MQPMPALLLPTLIVRSPQRKLRKKVEMSFAHLKRIHGLGRLRLRGPCGVHDEFILAATAQNLKKLAKPAPTPIRASAAQ
ncbi:transposase [Shimia sagamensis]|uniref:transposase n=1 Tax=Shimia sagamensis TaxID=1566352 RepID=UPI003D27F31F